MTKEENTTQNISALNKNMDVLKKNFSHCFDKNGDFDFDKFKKELSENEVNFSKESYGMDWLGKSYARLLASDSTTTLLKEDENFNTKEENKNSENLLIKGDNLEVLKHLSNAYYEKIKMIYIDPPYNTGSDGFVYQDDRKFTVNEFKNLAGVNEDKAKQILNFVDSKSNSHSAWLTFMYPRLYIAKQLLKDDGVIFISIDDNEVSQLKLLMDEIFGEENFVADFIWLNNQRGRSTDKLISNTNENILMYSKNIDICNINQELETDKKKLALFILKDNISYYKKGDNLFNNNSQFNIETRPNLVYSIYVDKESNEWFCVDEKIKDKNGNLFLPLENKMGDNFIKIVPPLRNTNNKLGCWRWGINKFNKEAKQELLLDQKMDGSYMFYTKSRLDNSGQKWNTFKNTISDFSSSSGTRELVSIFNNKIFNSPKPSKLLKKIVSIGISNNDLILDFFAGSGTTGDAVMQLNAEDNGTRKFILAQLPEVIDKKKNKVAYDFVKDELKIAEPTIFDITKERLIRASKKIQEENKEAKIELGFKVFETTPIWEDYNLESDTFNEKLQLFDELQLTEEDVKSLLITWKTNDGISLTNNLEEIDLGTYTAYYFEGKLYLMDKDFTTNNLKILLELIDTDKKINPASIIAFGYHFESKNLREISENIKSYANKKNIDIDFITRY
ncbi:site-specific DNA-methyltransferase [Tenacibaculum finnmarkense genomovar finnmarkense]|uniref:site-specific DNA-methyltransferase n=1 Tax=Tenacibaculum finnmarkense TaxID=2781243 RepID=UPI001E34CFE2|nr:site-specific DNA-methyltransferase [Tenacibaculum finnmarkense]MCD8418404.1 site-specific DNA-methyltransferase [Tenacibaculum finnmarkense genomovar finnmarkense]MCG8186818.1 site-specific DNA-methyltransferase [Tenacibaculum finnmarkense genomovar finnmarkense]MCG8210802.1 site-specific DNA-methyltransferase [Tenacibaculum finnmarkense genomovar finnmarkense]MCG8213627.1 site-specific DNA-methyltransferase [Tenacibaculum finnmarkense genomovar finnmarkense]MCG8220919.1 site-specific DNA-